MLNWFTTYLHLPLTLEKFPFLSSLIVIFEYLWSHSESEVCLIDIPVVSEVFSFSFPAVADSFWFYIERCGYFLVRRCGRIFAFGLRHCGWVWDSGFRFLSDKCVLSSAEYIGLKRRLYRLFLSPLRKESRFFSPQSFIVLSHWVPQLRMNPRFDLLPLQRKVGFHRPILRARRRPIVSFSPGLSPRLDLVYGFPSLRKALHFTLRPKVVSRTI